MAQFIGKLINSLIIGALLGFEAFQLFTERVLPGADALHQLFVVLFAVGGKRALELPDFSGGAGQRLFAQAFLLGQPGLFLIHSLAFHQQAGLELLVELFAGDGQDVFQLLFLGRVFPLHFHGARAHGGVHAGQPVAELGLQPGAFRLPVRGLLFQPRDQFFYGLLFQFFFFLQRGQLGAEGRLFFAYDLENMGMVLFLLRRQGILYFLDAGLGGVELFFAQVLLFQQAGPLGLPGGLQRAHLGGVVRIHRPQFFVQPGFQHAAQLAVILFVLALLQKVLFLQFGAAGVQLAFGGAEVPLQRAYLGGQLLLAGLEGGLQRGHAALVAVFQLGAQSVVLLLGLRQAPGVLAFHFQQAGVPALYHGALIAVQFFEFIRIFGLKAVAQAVQLGLFFQELLDVQLAFAQQRHGGFQFGVEIFFLLQVLGAGGIGVGKRGLFDLQALGGFLGKGQVLFELSLVFFNGVKPFQRPAQRHAGGIQAGHVIYKLFEFAVFFSHNFAF